MTILPACKHVDHRHPWYLLMPKGCAGSLGTWVTDGFDLVQGINPRNNMCCPTATPSLQLQLTVYFQSIFLTSSDEQNGLPLLFILRFSSLTTRGCGWNPTLQPFSCISWSPRGTFMRPISLSAEEELKFTITSLPCMKVLQKVVQVPIQWGLIYAFSLWLCMSYKLFYCPWGRCCSPLWCHHEETIPHKTNKQKPCYSLVSPKSESKCVHSSGVKHSEDMCSCPHRLSKEFDVISHQNHNAT